MSRQISFDEMVRLALQEEERRRWAAYPDRETLRETYGDLSALKARIDATLRAHRRQKEQALPRRVSLRSFKRALILAAILLALFSGIILVSAEIPMKVKQMIVEWTERDVGISYEVEGAAPQSLPADFGPHYIPEGFEYVEEESYKNEYYINNTYRTEDELEFLNIRIYIYNEERETNYWTDSENIVYEQIIINNVLMNLGIFQKHTGYVLEWMENGLNYRIYISADIDIAELYRIAENIY